MEERTLRNAGSLADVVDRGGVVATPANQIGGGFDQFGARRFGAVLGTTKTYQLVGFESSKKRRGLVRLRLRDVELRWRRLARIPWAIRIVHRAHARR